MRRRMLTLLLLAAPLTATAAEPGAQKAKAAAELKAITEQLNDLDTWFGASDHKLVELQREIEASDRAIATATAALEAAARDANSIEAELLKLRQDADGLRSRQAAQARQIADHLGAARRLEGEDFLKLLLNQESPADFDRMVRYHRYFSAARLASLEDYRQTLTEVATNERRLNDRLAEARLLEAAQAHERERISRERDERKSLISRLETEQEDQRARRQELTRDRQRLETLITELERKALKLDGRSFAQSRGKLPWPLDGKILHGFGSARAEGRMHWDGILIAAQEGTSFRAVQSGRVVFADWLRGYGLLVIVDHGSGFMTLYGQADSLGRGVGDLVKAGDILGHSGRSGGNRQPGLYFELRQNGQARDPVSWLAKR